MKVRPRSLGLAGVLLLMFAVGLLVTVPEIVKQQVTAKVQIDPDSGLAYTMWRDIPIPLYMSLYLFEVKNPQEILNGEKPVLEERGPYVYREYRWKSNITFHNNYTVSYREYKRYHFCPERSAGSESDEIVLPNVLALMNNSNAGLFTVYTGVNNIAKVHLVDNWNGLKEVNYWRSDQCNMINGTAGEMWPPFMTPSDALTFFSPDSCRTLELVFQKSGRTFGLPSFRYIAPKTMFANGTVYPPNEGFCPCRQSGVLNVSTCRHNAQVFISYPHFYNADPVLWEAVSGLHPNEKDHALFIDIHPLTGIPLNVSIKLQLNLFVKAVHGITETGNIQPVLLPLLWFDEMGRIDGPPLHTFYNFLVLVPNVFEYLQYTLIAVGCLLVLIAVVVKIVHWKQQISVKGISSGTDKESQGASASLLPAGESNYTLLQQPSYLLD
ncbi:scavenger receptor class B member 1 isoform X2 [Carcharodon carcharias]|uniref:scavenger receptor class B member 1 isoform X2 n=1 Tax=Carcharodon carcharias TaxID=13397 RepID=UPI001B7EAA06|nr:scavenger receptor class B member 1 isoform X2 [Carcharodon carcharias]